MILAPNRQQPLSGSKILFLSILILIIGCSPSARMQKEKGDVVLPQKELNKDSVSYEDSAPPKNEAKKDAESDLPGKKNVDNIDAPVKKYEHHTIAVVLPFSTNESNQRFFQYYGGMKLAADELSMEGYDLTVNVYNAEDPVIMERLQTDPATLIFAPSDEQLLKQLVELGQSKNIHVVSPFFSLSSVENTPTYIQLKPSLRSHFVAIIRHALENFSADEIVLVGRNSKSDVAWFKFFQNSASELGQNQSSTQLKEFFVADDSIAMGSNVFGDLLSKGKKAFIFPNYSYKDELYLYNSMRRLLAEKGGFDITVYGMPILKDSEKMNFDFFNGLDIHVPASRYIEEARDEVKSFDRKFFDRFGALPEGDAYEGFDHFLFIARHLSQYGAEFARYLSTDNGQYLQSKFDVRATHTEGSNTEIDFFENKYLEMLHFDGTRFVKSY